MSTGNVDFQKFVDKQYAGIPDRTETIEDKERAIKAKKAILKHPDCPQSSKAEIKREIAAIEGEIAAMKGEARNNSMNSSIFGTRNDLG